MAGQVLPAKDLPTAADWLTAQPAVRHVESLPARVAHTSSWPHWVHPALLATLLGDGLAAPWSHQREAMDLARSLAAEAERKTGVERIERHQQILSLRFI